MLPRSRLSDALSQRPIRRQFHIAGPHNRQAAAPPTAAACTAARSLLLRRNPFDGVVPDRVHQRTARLNTTKVSDAAIAGRVSRKNRRCLPFEKEELRCTRWERCPAA